MAAPHTALEAARAEVQPAANAPDRGATRPARHRGVGRTTSGHGHTAAVESCAAEARQARRVSPQARGGRDSAAFSRCTPRRPAPPSIREVAPPSIREVAHRASGLCAGSHTRARPGESLGSLRGELERTGLAAPGQERNLPRGRASIEKRGRKRALFLRSQPVGKRRS